MQTTTNPASAKQAAYLKDLMLQVPDYTRGGFGQDLTDRAQQVFEMVTQDSKKTSDSIRAMNASGIYGSRPRTARKTRKPRTNRSYYCSRAGFSYSSKFDHDDGCQMC